MRSGDNAVKNRYYSTLRKRNRTTGATRDSDDESDDQCGNGSDDEDYVAHGVTADALLPPSPDKRASLRRGQNDGGDDAGSPEPVRPMKRHRGAKTHITQTTGLVHPAAVQAGAVFSRRMRRIRWRV